MLNQRLKILFITAVCCALVTESKADVFVDVGTPKKKDFKPGVGLIEILQGTQRITCRTVVLRGRKGEEEKKIDLPKFLETLKDYELQDEDVIFAPRHYFPCMSSEQETAPAAFSHASDFRTWTND